MACTLISQGREGGNAKFGGCDPPLSLEWGPYLALPDGQNPRFGGWRLKPRVQARDRTTQYRPRGGVGPGQTTLHIANVLYC